MANYRRVFLEGYSYYITIVTHLRQAILIEHIEQLRESFRESKYYYAYRIDAIVILPDHLHMIITPHNANEYPDIIKAIKYNFTKRYRANNSIHQSSSRLKDRMKPVWQKRYYEHTIRDEQDWNEKMKYIKENPIKHGLVDASEDWEYSSFKT